MDRSVLYILSKENPACLAEAQQALSRTPGYEVLDIRNYAEALTVVQSGWSGIVVPVISSKEELAGAIKFLTALAPLLKKHKTIRAIAFSSIPGSKVQTALLRLACSEVLDFSLPGRSFLHKLQQHFRMIRTPKKPSATNPANSSNPQAKNATPGLKKNKPVKSLKPADGPKSGVKTTAPLSHPSDYWLTRSKPDAKRIMGRWLVELIGPGPSVGAWTPIPLKESDSKIKAFEWKLRDPNSPFGTPSGRWVFLGRQVDFVWRVNRWRFVGERVSLNFYEGDKIVAKRFATEIPEEITICENSANANSVLPLIQATFNGKKRFEETDEEDSREEEDSPSLAEDDASSDESQDEFDDGSDESIDPETGAKRRSKKRKKKRKTKSAGKSSGQPGEADIELEDGRSADPEFEDSDDDEEDSPDFIREDDDDESTGSETEDYVLSDDEGEGPEWNDQSDTPDPESPEFNDHGARRQNIFNSGRGLTQGQKSDRVTYDDEDFAVGADAFKPIGLNTTLDGTAAQILESNGDRLTIRCEAGSFKNGAFALLSVETENLKPQNKLETKCQIIKVETNGDTPETILEAQLTLDAVKLWEKIQDAVTARQMDILRFLKLAKGA